MQFNAVKYFVKKYFQIIILFIIGSAFKYV
uniref:Uncharacterized protein n=1 Tax=Anguilla anguilla TaxID=7936 RepID=A0A0E9TDS8_ANGAN